MTLVNGLDTRHNFPDYIMRRPAMALRAADSIGKYLQHCIDEGVELPELPPFSVLMWIEMASVLKELAPDEALITLEVPTAVRKWLR